MPDLETMDRFDSVVYWECTGHDYAGEPILASPVPLLVRWDNDTGETTDDKGNTVAFHASMVLDQEVKLDSNVLLGEITDYLGTGTTPAPNQVMVVIMFNGTSSICGRFQRYEAKLSRFGSNPSPAE